MPQPKTGYLSTSAIARKMNVERDFLFDLSVPLFESLKKGA